MLWILQQHLTGLCYRPDVSVPGGRLPDEGLRCPAEQLRQRLHRQHLHRCVRHGWYRWRAHPGHGLPTQGPQGARAIPIYRLKDSALDVLSLESDERRHGHQQGGTER